MPPYSAHPDDVGFYSRFSEAVL